jgi:hypothetical protein
VSLKLSSEPILTVYLTTPGSNEADESGFHSILAISGCAGNGADGTSDAPKFTGAVVKTIFYPEGARHSVAKLRHRFRPVMRATREQEGNLEYYAVAFVAMAGCVLLVAGIIELA